MKELSIVTLYLVLSNYLGESTATPPFQLPPLRTSLNSEENNLLVSQAPSIRLPAVVAPFHYDLRIRPILNKPISDPEQFTAPGFVSILLSCLIETDQVTLHSQDIQIIQENVVLKTYPEGMLISIVGHDVNSSSSTYTILLGESLTASKNYSLDIPFISLVSDKLEGLYRSSYKDEMGNTKWLAATQFQKFGARQAFPCFDEPSLKATFNTTIGRTMEFHSLTNSPLISTVENPDNPGWYWDSFETTVPMSSYLVAIIVSDFVDVVAPQNLSSYVVKTWGPPTITSNATGEYSAQAAAKILTYFENYFESKYQFPKLDSVAVPDFAAGAMENWALNTYRVNLMLWFEGESTQFEQWRQSAVIAHEISHHWFGDLVTCSWWNDAWLNEGFARYMQFRGSNATGSDFGQYDRYVLDTLQPALEFDVTSASIPVWSNNTATDTAHPSRTIYEKGASLIRMMQAFITEETLIVGLRNYLEMHSYSVAVQDDLFAVLQHQAEIDGTNAELSVKEIMDTWTVKVGFPLVRVTLGGSDTVLFSQEIFKLPKQNHKQNPDDTWNIPINFVTKSDSVLNLRPKFWLDQDTLVQSYRVANASIDWILVNPDARNYYRVLYDDHFFRLLKTQLDENHSVFTLATRSQLFDDYFQSSLAGYVNIQSALDLTTYLAEENENTVWTTVLKNLRPIYGFLLDQEASNLFREYLSPKLEAVLDRIGWDQETNDSPVTVFLRSQVLDWSCSFGSTKCLSLSTKLITEWATDPSRNKIPADLQPMIFCKAISAADSLLPSVDIRNLVLAEYAKSSRNERFQLFINSLACESNNTNVELLMQMTIDPSSAIDRGAHGVWLLQKLAENPVYRVPVFRFLDVEAENVIKELGESAFTNVMSTIASYTTSADIIDKINGFIESLSSRGIVSDSTLQSLKLSQAKLSENSAWITQFYDDIDSWLLRIKR